MFPCVAGSKRPATPHGFKDASTDPDVIDAWWAADEFNVAFSPGDAGWTVLDVDPDKGGFDSLAALELCHGPLDTLQIATPSGGLHAYFQGATPRNSAGKLGPGLDTRSVGGYVLIPPSATDRGSYRVAIDRVLAPTPDWLVAALEAQRNVTAGSTVGLDLPDNVALFKHYMQTRDPAVEGARNEVGTAHVGMACDMGLSRDVAWPIIAADWGARCHPPIDLDDKLYECGVWFHRQNEGHPWALDGTPSETVFADVLADLPADYERFHLYTIDELLSRPKPQWLPGLTDIIRERSLGYLYGPTENYKSFIAALLAMTVARERPVIYALGEGQEEFAQRLVALRERTGDGHLLRVADSVPIIGLDGDVASFIKSVKASGITPSLIFLDTLAVAMESLDESAAKDMNRFVAAMKRISRDLGCAVCAVHHKSDKPNAVGERGSSVLKAGVDFVGEVAGVQETQTAKLTIRKQRGTQKRKAPFFYQGEGKGDAFAFREIQGHEYDALNSKGRGSMDVAGALAAHDVVGEEAGVTTQVLATWLRPPVQGERTEDTETALAAIVTDLKHRAKRDLYGYCGGEGAKLRWFILEKD